MIVIIAVDTVGRPKATFGKKTCFNVYALKLRLVDDTCLL